MDEDFLEYLFVTGQLDNTNDKESEDEDEEEE